MSDTALMITVIAALAVLGALDVMAAKFGADSRDGFTHIS
jgi:hypothetical protein